jgi:hypothetical protein
MCCGNHLTIATFQQDREQAVLEHQPTVIHKRKRKITGDSNILLSRRMLVMLFFSMV